MVWGWEDDGHGGAPEADTLVHGQVLSHISLPHPGAQSGNYCDGFDEVHERATQTRDVQSFVVNKTLGALCQFVIFKSLLHLIITA